MAGEGTCEAEGGLARHLTRAGDRESLETIEALPAINQMKANEPLPAILSMKPSK